MPKVGNRTFKHTPNNMFCRGQVLVTDRYRDGHERTFGRGYPAMSQHIKKKLYRWAGEEDYFKIMLFFTCTCGFDKEYSSFLLRELIRGYV